MEDCINFPLCYFHLNVCRLPQSVKSSVKIKQKSLEGVDKFIKLFLPSKTGLYMGKWVTEIETV